MFQQIMRLFPDGGAGAGAGSSAPAGDAGQGQAAPGVKTDDSDAAIRAYRQRKGLKVDAPIQHVVDDKAQPEAQRPASAEAKPAERDLKAEYRKLIEGEYKDVHGEYVGELVQKRLKNVKGAEEALSKVSPVLDVLYQQYGVEAGNVEALVAKLQSDDSLYEEEALQKGVPVEVLKQMKANEHQLKTLQMQAEYRQQQERQAEVDRMLESTQAEMRKTYPRFDIRAELYGPQQETYRRLLAAGVDVKTAFEVVNKDKIQPAMAAAVAQKTAQDLSRAIQSGSRPAENGLSGRGTTATLADDLTSMPYADRRKLYDAIKSKRTQYRPLE